MNTIKKLLHKVATKRKWLTVLASAMAVACIAVAFPMSISTNPDNAILTLGHGRYSIIIGNIVGATDADYTCDGIDDHVQFQAALDALPAIGGQLLILAGNYSWGVGETVARAIDNISVVGVGASVSFTGDGVTAIFTVGGDNWFFGNLITDAGGLSMGATTNWMWFNLTIDTTYYSVRTDTVDLGATITGIDVEVSELGVATYDDVQDYINFFGDRTLLSGGAITAHGDADGSVAIAAATGWCKEADSDTAVGNFFDYAGKAKQTLTDLSINAIYLDYNAGTPQIVVALDYATYGFQQDHILMGAVFRQGTAVHIFQIDTLGIQGINRAFMHQVEHHGPHRASGLVTTDGGSLALSISAGVIYAGLTRQITTVDGSTWSYWYTSDSGSTWTEDTSQSVLVQSYNDITSGKVALTSNRFGVHWVYVDYEGTHVHVVYGQGDYTAFQAEAANVPGILPPIVASYGILIAKIINQEGTDTLTIVYPWTTVFTSSLATDHGSLAGLGDDDHPQYIQHSLATAANDFLVASGAGAYIKKTLAETKAILNWAADIATHAALTTGVHGLGSLHAAGVRDASYIQVVRSATYVVVASNAAGHVKSQADIVCDQADALTAIQGRIDATTRGTIVVIGLEEPAGLNYTQGVSVTYDTPYFHIKDIPELDFITTIATNITSATADSTRNTTVDGDYLYFLLRGGGALLVYDIKNITSPVLVGSVATKGYCLDKRGNYLITSSETGLVIIDVSDPTNPFIATTLALDLIHGHRVYGNYYFAANHLAGKISIVDISDLLRPTLIAEMSGTTYFDSPHDIWVDGKYAYVTNYATGAGENGLTVVDITNPSKPSVVSGYYENRQFSYVAKRGNKLLIGTHSPDSGVIVADVSNPHAITTIHEFSSSVFLNGYWVDFWGDYAVIMDTNGKIHLLNLETLDVETLYHQTATTGGKHIYVHEDLLFYSYLIAANYEPRVDILQFNHLNKSLQMGENSVENTRLRTLADEYSEQVIDDLPFHNSLLANGLQIYLPLYAPWQKASPLTSDDANMYATTVAGALWTPAGRQYRIGESDHLVTEAFAFDATNNEMTILAWVKWEKRVGVQSILAEAALTDPFIWFRRNDNDNYISVYYHDGTSARNKPCSVKFSTMHSAYDNKWVLIGVSIKFEAASGGYFDFILNGYSERIVATNYPMNFPSIDRAKYVGSYSTTLNLFKGTMGEVWVYNRVFDESDVYAFWLATKNKYR